MPFDVENCDAVYFYACKNDTESPGFKKYPSKTIVFDLTKTFEELWKDVGKSTRKYIRQATKYGINLHLNEHYDEFLELYKKFVDKKHFRAFPFSKESMQKMGTLFTAEWNGKILSGILTVEDDENIRSLLGGSIRFEIDKETARVVTRANRFIIWKIIEYAKEKGYREFDLGGYYGGEDKNDPKSSIDYFKSQFGGYVTQYYNYEKYYSKTYYLLKKATAIL